MLGVAVAAGGLLGLASLYPVMQALAPSLHDPAGVAVKSCTPGTARRHLQVCEYPDGSLRSFDASVQPPRPTSLPDEDMRRILAGDPAY